MTVAPVNQWIECAGCSAVPGACSALFMEQLTPIGVNQLPSLHYIPDMRFMLLTVNGQAFMPVGPEPAFTVSGQQIVWGSPIYSFAPGDAVQIAYSYLGQGS